MVSLLIHLPTDPRRLQPLSVRCPLIPSRRGRFVVATRSTSFSLGIHRSRHPVHAIGYSWAKLGTMIGVTNGERLGESELKGYVGAFVIAHAIGGIHNAVALSVGKQPIIHFAPVPCQ